MLTPDEIARLGESSERRASGVVDGLVEIMAKMAAEALAAMDEGVPSAVDVPRRVLAYLASHPVERADEVERERGRAEARSDRNDAAALGVAAAALAGSALGSRRGRSVAAVPTGAVASSAVPTGAVASSAVPTGADYVEREVRAFLTRANLAMAADAQATYRRVVADGIRMYKSGAVNYEAAMVRMCREIARAGVSTVRYRSGVRVQADSAVRRHVQSMVRKAADERTLDAALRLGYRLVEVSSHGAARPSHRRWQGKVFSLVGDIEIDGVHYKDFYRETGYGDVGGLGGANCRHSFAPYAPGRPRRWEELDEETEDRRYRLSQRQRANEREIRAWKREAMACRAAGVDDTDARLGLGRAQKKQREFLAAHPELQRRPGREQVFEPDGSTAKVSPLAKAVNADAPSRKAERKVSEIKKRCAGSYRPVYFESGDAFGINTRANWGKLSKRYEGEYIVAAHGSPKTVRLYDTRASHRVLADVIKARKDYEPGKPIRLLSCSTGDNSGGRCFAQRLADALGVDVTAPDKTLWLFPDGRVTIGEEKYDDDGEWVTFHPQKKEGQA